MSINGGQIIIQLEGTVVQTIPLSAPVLSIGRTPDNGLTLPHPMVSRRHAELRLQPEGLILTDVGSSNGTFVEGARLLPHQPRLLTSGTVFQIGPFQLIYQGGAEARQEADGDKPEAVEELPVDVQAVEPVASPEPAMPPAPPAPPRPTYLAPAPLGPVSRYLNDLPVIFQDNDFLGRFLLIFETIWEPLEQRQDHIEMYFDPRTCPASFLGWLASWLDLSVNAHWPESRIRRLLAEAMDLYRWRGTRYGLTRMIEVCTGLTPHVSDDPAQPFVFRVSVEIPPGSDVDRRLVEDLILAHKPAHSGYILEVTP